MGRYTGLSLAPHQRALNGYRSSSESLTDGASTIADVHTYRPLIPGVYVPTMCFFEAKTEEIDTTTIAQHAVRLARAGVTGLATQGSNGEAVHLTHAERYTVTATTRRALNENGFSHLPIIVGCGSQSTRETIEYCREAYEAGGDYALVLPPSYYATLFAPASETILNYFTTVADSSPIPILIYNFPGGANGVDLSSDVIIKLSQHPNIVGVKLTCGNTGKLNRVASATRGRRSRDPRWAGEPCSESMPQDNGIIQRRQPVRGTRAARYCVERRLGRYSGRRRGDKSWSPSMDWIWRLRAEPSTKTQRRASTEVERGIQRSHAAGEDVVGQPGFTA